MMFRDRDSEAAAKEYAERRREALQRTARRLRRVNVTVDLLGELLKDTAEGRVYKVRTGIPVDASIVRLGYDIASDCVVGIFHHPSFPMVGENETIPVGGMAVEYQDGEPEGTVRFR